MSIVPLPVFEADADPSRRDAMTDEEILARLRPPTSIVVRFGSMRLVGEFPYSGDAKPGCGSKLVVRTVRGTEMGEMLTTTCSNSGCGKSVSRKEMLEYIEASGGKDYPFQEHGRVLRVATIEDLNRWSQMQAEKPTMLRRAREIVAAAGMTIRIVEVEPILGGETTLIHYLSEERIDFRDVLKEFATAFESRIDMRHVGARDEARLVADYERCGQHCCCKNFLKVLKPVSMRSAKVQKATLDPLKISGRCGRLMCCLRYEDQTYTELKARLPKLKTRVGTSEGPGIVMDTKILVQLALVRLEHDGREIAVPIEELMDPDACPAPGSGAAESDPLRGADPSAVARRTRGGPRRGDQAGSRTGSRGDRGSDTPSADDRRRRGSTAARDASDGARDGAPPRAPKPERGPTPASPGGAAPTSTTDSIGGATGDLPRDSTRDGEGAPPRKRRRRRRGKSSDRSDAPRVDRPDHGDAERTTQEQQDAFRARAQAEERRDRTPSSDGEPSNGDASDSGAPTRKRRRRGRRRRGGGGGGSGDGGGVAPSSS